MGDISSHLNFDYSMKLLAAVLTTDTCFQIIFVVTDCTGRGVVTFKYHDSRPI